MPRIPEVSRISTHEVVNHILFKAFLLPPGVIILARCMHRGPLFYFIIICVFIYEKIKLEIVLDFSSYFVMGM